MKYETLSNCCGAPIEDDTDICTDCHEHCGGGKVCELCDGTGKIDILDREKINSQTISPPEKTIPCIECCGTGVIEVEL